MGGNAANTGEMPGPGPDDANGVEAIWQFPLTDDDEERGAGTQAVVDGVVYVGGFDAESHRGILYALNAGDGTERWRFITTEYEFARNPAVVDGTVYVPSHKVRGGGSLYALNANDGSERWRFTADGAMDSPVVVDGAVYVGGAGSLYAVNASDGTKRWQFTTTDDEIGYPTVVDGVVYAQSWRTLYAIGAHVPKLSVGGIAQAIDTTVLRGGPALTAVKRAELKPDTVVTITGESATTGGVIWWPVSVDKTGDQGWVQASDLKPLTSGPEPTPAS